MGQWRILDAHQVDIEAIEQFCADFAPQVALMVEYLDHLRYSPHVRDYVLCVVPADTTEIAGICWIGGNIVPVNIPPGAAADLMDEIRRRGRRYSSMVGPKVDVDLLAAHMGRSFGQPRDIRAVQPHLEIHSRPEVTPDPDVAATSIADFDLLLPAAVHMFTEEVGYSPLASGGGYEERVRFLITQRRSLARIIHTKRGREVLFKADLGTVGYGVTQIQGVWVNPEYRGQGIAVPAIAATVNYAHQNFAPTVSLYVNDYNAPALAAYRRVGFEQTDTFATILF